MNNTQRWFFVVVYIDVKFKISYMEMDDEDDQNGNNQTGDGQVSVKGIVKIWNFQSWYTMNVLPYDYSHWKDQVKKILMKITLAPSVTTSMIESHTALGQAILESVDQIRDSIGMNAF